MKQIVAAGPCGRPGFDTTDEVREEILVPDIFADALAAMLRRTVESGTTLDRIAADKAAFWETQFQRSIYRNWVPPKSLSFELDLALGLMAIRVSPEGSGIWGLFFVPHPGDRFVMRGVTSALQANILTSILDEWRCRVMTETFC